MDDEFRQFWVSLDADGKRELTAALETNKDYLSQIAHGHRSPGKHFRRSLVTEMRRMKEGGNIAAAEASHT